MTNSAEKNPPAEPRFRVLVLAENGGHHLAFSQRARTWLDELAAESQFAVDYIVDPDHINETYLAPYRLFIQLDYPPYGWGDRATKAFQNYIEAGKGGWIGLHHASLLGEFDGCPMWNWFSTFMGGIRWKDYIADLARATVIVEEANHPIMQGVPASFSVSDEEWYAWDRSPRPRTHVIASVDETTYDPDSKIKMGDHPVVWTNLDVKARNVYIFMGHSPELFDNAAYLRIFRNAIFWAADLIERPT